MHQQQWLAVIDELGGYEQELPIPNSFPQSDENQRFSYVFVDPRVGDAEPLTGRFTHGRSLDGRGEFSVVSAEPPGQEPQLAPARPGSGAQREQLAGARGVEERVTSARART
jgi:Mn-containing catalase